MFHLRFVNLLLFILLQLVLFSSQDKAQLQQVPVCAPLPGSPGSDSQGSFQGPKGSQGAPGKRGAAGVKGERGYPGYPWGQGGCPTVTHHFPRADQTSDYVQYRSYVPAMKESTICAWIEMKDRYNIAILGYTSPATAGANDMTIFIHNKPIRIRLYVRDDVYDLKPTFPLAPKFHLCLAFSSKLNQRSLYINGDEVKRISRSTASIARGGILVLGQDHDDKNGGRFEGSQSFRGNITNFMIWPRVLTGQEISDIARNCDCPYDHAIAMTLDKIEHFGEAYYSIPDQCPTV